jgi:hypothetical protein
MGLQGKSQISIQLKIIYIRAGGVAQAVDHMPSKLEAEFKNP